jgi:polar amino acid transport system permease protein
MPWLAISFDWGLFLDRLFAPDSVFLWAVETTIVIAVIAQTVGVGLGLLAYLGTRARPSPLKLMSYGYILVFRGTPVVVQIFFVFFGANLFLGFNLFPRSINFLGFELNGAILAGTVALALNEGAYMSEIIRAGIEAIDRGQTESALSVGMTHRLAMRRIVLPQAARVIIPPLGNQFNNMLKTTSLLSFIGVAEMFQNAEVLYSTNFKPVEIFLAVALWYLLLTTVWSLIQVQIERKFGASEIDEDEDWFTRFLGVQRDVRANR